MSVWFNFIFINYLFFFLFLSLWSSQILIVHLPNFTNVAITDCIVWDVYEEDEEKKKIKKHSTLYMIVLSAPESNEHVHIKWIRNNKKMCKWNVFDEMNEYVSFWIWVDVWMNARKKNVWMNMMNECN